MADGGPERVGPVSTPATPSDAERTASAAGSLADSMADAAGREAVRVTAGCGGRRPGAGRPRKYAIHAERHRAYRQRQAKG